MYCLTACKSKYYFSNRQIFAIFLFIYRSEILAGTIVGSLLVHTEGVPCCRTEDVLILDIVHAYRYAEDRTECQHRYVRRRWHRGWLPSSSSLSKHP